MLSSCTNEDKPEPQLEGNFKLNLSILDETIVEKSNERISSVSIDDLLISIYSDDSTAVIEDVPYKDMSNGILLSEGFYKVEVNYGTPNDFVFDNPVYYGESTFEVLPGQISQVNVSVSLVNAKIKIVFSDTLQSLYPDINVTVRADTIHSVVIDKDVDQILYVLPQHIYLDVNYETDPEENWLTFQIPNVRKNDFYRVTFSAVNQGGKFSLIIEEENIIDLDFNVPVQDGYILPVSPGSGDDSTSVVFPDHVALTTQVGFDNFVELGITKIEGSLSINTDEITDISRLSTLREVTGHVYLTGLSSIVNLDGFRNLKKIGGDLRVYGQFQTKLDAFLNFAALDSVKGDLYIANLPVEAESFGFLSNLKYVGGDFEIRSCYFLSSLTGFDDLDTIEGDINFENNKLLSDYCDFDPNILIKNRGSFACRSNKYNPSRTSLENGLCRQ
ncbi:hypothetical protein AVL50_31850 [Flammeovirga sp. SJP92]|nr:hypothetical protein AVL50_31850 [Flammeovirga sp. SJP92]